MKKFLSVSFITVTLVLFLEIAIVIWFANTPIAERSIIFDAFFSYFAPIAAFIALVYFILIFKFKNQRIVVTAVVLLWCIVAFIALLFGDHLMYPM